MNKDKENIDSTSKIISKLCPVFQNKILQIFPIMQVLRLFHNNCKVCL